MSDREVVFALDALEQLLQGDFLEPDAIAAWRGGFDQAVLSATRGPEWAAIVARAHALAKNLDARTEALVAQRELLRRELDLQGQGARALKGYKST